MEEKIVQLGTSLGEIAIRNTAGAIHDKLRTIKSKKNDKATIGEMEEIINELIDDKNELISISRAFEEEVKLKKISDEEIEYISEEFIPVIEAIIGKGNDSGEENSDVSNMISILKPLISVQTFTILQSIGFNFKKGLGEPLTNLLRTIIESKKPLEKEQEYEIQKLAMERDVQLHKILSDENAYRRYIDITRA